MLKESGPRLAVLVVITWLAHLSEQYFFNGIKSGLDADLKHSLFLRRVGQCEGQRHLAIYLADAQIAQQNNTHYIVSGVLTVRRNITDGPLEGTVTIAICHNETQCRPFIEPPVTIGDVCELFTNGSRSHSIFGQILGHSIPELRCPLSEGIFRLVDIPLDYKPFRYFSPHVSKIWRIDLSGVSHGRRVFCVRIEMFVYSWEDMLPRY
ncbi:uncharacterized protein LOC126576815 [Anopheles aquasalis]|uniref:uncharacterized protein LOC126576815 n=1 Tax=Anopheles aquasalis TaxID=42839 RepID=UPI00215A961E|nr:uncharacterized protein LOC126576815 [Anopheles aquasalis]